MQVLKTTSPRAPSGWAGSAPMSHPSKTAPDSRARRPRSATSHLGAGGDGPGEPLAIVVDEGTVDQGHEHTPGEAGAEQRSVLGAGAEMERLHSPFRGRVEEDAGRRLADTKAGLPHPPGRAEHPVDRKRDG